MNSTEASPFHKAPAPCPSGTIPHIPFFVLRCFQPGISPSLWLWEYHARRSRTWDTVSFSFEVSVETSLLWLDTLLDLPLYFLVLCDVNNYSHKPLPSSLQGGGKRPQALYSIYYTVMLIVWKFVKLLHRKENSPQSHSSKQRPALYGLWRRTSKRRCLCFKKEVVN